MAKPFDLSFLGRTVRITLGHPIWQFTEGSKFTMIDLKPSYVNQECIIINSYNLCYGNIENVGKLDDKYCLLFPDGNRVSWFLHTQFEFIK